MFDLDDKESAAIFMINIKFLFYRLIFSQLLECYHLTLTSLVTHVLFSLSHIPMQSVPIATNVVRIARRRGVLDTTVCDKVCQ